MLSENKKRLGFERVVLFQSSKAAIDGMADCVGFVLKLCCFVVSGSLVEFGVQRTTWI